jgi:peptide/nickel transport system permease protein
MSLVNRPVEPAASTDAPPVPPAERRRRRLRPTVTDALSLAWLVVLVVAMFLLPHLLDLDPDKLSAPDRLAGISGDHLLGADNYGRDILARCLAGARVSLLISIVSVGAAALVGVPLGMVAGYYRGWADAVISFVVDVILAFPGLILALALAAFLGASVHNVMIAIAVPMFPVFVRLAKAQTMSVAKREYVEASQVIGTPGPSILLRDVLPNIAEAMLAFTLVSIGQAILIEGGLSFLGMGVPSTQATWGSMINFGRGFITTHPTLVAIPSAFMLFTILALNLLADRYLARQAGSRR